MASSATRFVRTSLAFALVLTASGAFAAPSPAERETARLIPHRRSKMGAMLRAVGSGRPASVEMFADDELAHEVTRVMARERISLIYAFSGQMAQYVPPELGSARFLMDFVDVDSEKFAGYARTHGLLSSFANGFEAKRLRAFEASVAQRADLCLFVSEAEADLFCRVHGAAGGSVAALENGVDEPVGLLDLHDQNLT